MADKFSDKQRGYRAELKNALSETPEPHRQRVYRVVESIYRDCAEQLNDRFNLEVIEHTLSKLSKELGGMIGRDHSAYPVLMREAGLYNGMASGDEEGSVPNRLKHIIVDKMNLKWDNVPSDASLVDDLGVDSLEMVEIVMEIEDEFGVSIPDSKVGELNTIPALVAYLNEQTQ